MGKSSLITFLIVSCVFLTCENKNALSRKNEGVIEYNISFANIDSKNALNSILPKKMQFHFMEGKMASKLSAAYGSFETTYIMDHSNQSLNHLLKVLNSKITNEISYADFEKTIDDCSIEFLNETKNIAGFECKKAIASFKSNKVTLYYTEEIQIENPNWWNPFHEVPGVLLSYELEQFKLAMQLEANEVKFIEQDSTVFMVSKDYKKVGVNEINEELEEMIELLGL